jgi:hypothetical protein
MKMSAAPFWLRPVAPARLAPSVVGAVALLYAAPAFAYTWPADSAWVTVLQGGAAIGDVTTDGSNNGREVVGDASSPAVYVYYDKVNHWFFVRLRLDDTPLQSAANLRPYGWGIVIDSDANLGDYEYGVLVDGISEDISFLQNTVGTGAGDPSDTAEVVISSEVTNYTSTGNVRVSTATSTFGSTADYFLDIAISDTGLVAAGLDTAPLRIVAGTSGPVAVARHWRHHRVGRWRDDRRRVRLHVPRRVLLPV